MTDPISDMLTRIRNAQATRKISVWIPFSKLKMHLATILERERYVAKAEREERAFPVIRLDLKYSADRQPVIRTLKRISRPGCRIYASSADLPRVQQGMGIAIVSTSKGLMTNHEARKAKMGGEVLCEII